MEPLHRHQIVAHLQQIPGERAAESCQVAGITASCVVGLQARVAAQRVVEVGRGLAGARSEVGRGAGCIFC